MRPDSRLNLLLTPPPAPRAVTGVPLAQPWHQTVSRLLVPLGVRTFEATSGTEAMELIERHPIHLAVVDTRLPSISGMNVLQLIQRLRERGQHLPSPPATLSPPAASASPPASENPEVPATIRFHMQMEEKTEEGSRRFEVRIDAQVAAAPKSPCGPIVILIAPPPEQQDKQLMQEALKFNAFSVLTEPVDVNVALDVMARAMKRWFSGQWPC
ncbi:MAG TPA: response regulator [Phycisphaerae bacterium]|nr:response regulator [Phycisphaerae bacterium]